MRWIDDDRYVHGRACVALCSKGYSKAMKDENGIRSSWVIEEMSKVLIDNIGLCDHFRGIICWVNNYVEVANLVTSFVGLGLL